MGLQIIWDRLKKDALLSFFKDLILHRTVFKQEKQFTLMCVCVFVWDLCVCLFETVCARQTQ